MKNHWLIRAASIVFIYFLFVQSVECRPNSRVKRVSDQRLAELNTKIGLSQMRGQLVTIPIAHGKFDPAQIGRKRRSQARLLDILLNRSDEDNLEQNPQELLNYEDIYKKR